MRRGDYLEKLKQNSAGTCKLALFGAPYSGKTTLGKLLADELEFKHYSVGQIIRDKYAGLRIDPPNTVDGKMIVEVLELLNGAYDRVVVDGVFKSGDQLLDVYPWLQYNGWFCVFVKRVVDLDPAARGRADDATHLFNKLNDYANRAVEFGYSLRKLDAIYWEVENRADGFYLNTNKLFLDGVREVFLEKKIGI
jgi:hypothetical protein